MINLKKIYGEHERLTPAQIREQRLAEVMITLESGRRIYRYVNLIDGIGYVSATARRAE